MGSKIDCQCSKCDCKTNFEIIDGEELLNLIQHGRLDGEKIDFLRTRVGSKICKHCFVGKHS
ncbi:hypothetical protein [Nitrosopumilus sp.]|uniref:hypothetical protein n=1 Tax=Nitrosopumilus sp. TaxID=2024843 RepID=UPI00247B5065|nr:hypothetical protein [Nitrosopumilus sp.]MCV0430514.1 hypothetical protein [Nitrosopumilus sp.]